MTKRVTQAAERAVKAVREAVEAPGTETNRKAAEAIISLRRQYKHEGVPDWSGRSPAYRDMIARVYRDAGVPSDSGSNLQANLRYHLGNVVRRVAPADELAALGLQAEGPLGRVRETRKEQRRRPKPKVLGDPAALASAAHSLVRALRTMEMNGAGGEVEASLRGVIDESLDVIAELNRHN